jgi:hypothetical protein
MYSRLFVHTFPLISSEQPRIFVGVSGIHFERPQVVCKCVFDCVCVGSIAGVEHVSIHAHGSSFFVDFLRLLSLFTY